MKLFLPLCVLSSLLIGCASQPPADLAEAYPYHEPLSSPGKKFSGLPPAVQSTIRAQAGAAQMHDIIKSTDGNRVVYKVTFAQEKIFPPLYVASDGSVLYPDSYAVAVGAPRDEIGASKGGAASGLMLSDLPKKVVSTIQEKAPTAEVSHISKLSENGRVTYEVLFKNSAANPKLVVEEDGSVINDWQ